MIEFYGLVLTDPAPTSYDQLYRPFYLQLCRCYILSPDKRTTSPCAGHPTMPVKNR